MHDSCWLPPGKHFPEPRRIQQVALFERTEPDGVLPSGDQIIKGYWRVSRRFQSLTGVRADIARAAGYQDIGHEVLPYSAALPIVTISCR